MENQELDLHNPEFANALKLVNYTTRSLFLTGRAGTGKSTFLRYIAENAKKKCVVMAPTGIAAINAGGVTIHSFFKFPFRPLLPDDPDLSLQGRRIFDFLKYKKEHVRVIEETELFIIDEISMVRADIIDAIDRVLRVYTGNMRLPFGGKQLLLVGDVFQLEPVVKGDERDILKRFYHSPFFFSARVFQEMELVSIELRKVYRQSEPNFVNLLDRIRENKLQTRDLETINTRFKPNSSEEHPFNIILAGRRDAVDTTNQSKLEALEGDSFCFTGKITKEFPESSLPTDFILYLKKGAQVMFIKNDPEKRWYNGSIGEITHLEDDAIRVLLETGTEHEVEMETWHNIRYTYDDKKKCVVEEHLGSFTQYPIKLAWAITIHKSQGLTFERLTLDLGNGSFAGGQTYVALSRSRSLDGIHLLQPIKFSDIFVRKEVVAFSQQFNNQLLIENSLNDAKALSHYRDALQFFKQRNFRDAISAFAEAHLLQDKIGDALMQRFIAHQLNIIHSQQRTITELQSEIMHSSLVQESNAQELIQMAKTHMKAKSPTVAKSLLEVAVAAFPQCLDAKLLYADVCCSLKDYEEALGCFNIILYHQPHLFEALLGRGRILVQLKRYFLAIEDLKLATTLNPKHLRCRRELGDAYSKVGDVLNAALYWSR